MSRFRRSNSSSRRIPRNLIHASPAFRRHVFFLAASFSAANLGIQLLPGPEPICTSFEKCNSVDSILRRPLVSRLTVSQEDTVSLIYVRVENRFEMSLFRLFMLLFAYRNLDRFFVTKRANERFSTLFAHIWAERCLLARLSGVAHGDDARGRVLQRLKAET